MTASAWRGISRRIVLVSIGCGLLGLVASYAIGIGGTRDLFVRSTIPTSLYLWDHYEHSRCVASPSTWSLETSRGMTSYAYDAESLASANPAAPPLDRALLATIAPDAQPPLALRLRPIRGGAAVYRSSTRGDPCGVVMVQWTPRISKLDALQLLLTMALFASVTAAVLGAATIARPLSKLLRHLDDVTHDLRTPISSLQLAIEQAADATPDDATRELLHGAMKDVVYLGALTSNLRLASQLREGWDPRSAKATVDLSDVVERAAARARVLARRGGLALDVACPDETVVVACDPVAAEQAIGNVIDNAVAYGDRGGHVAVVLERAGGAFALRIEDDGPGVAPGEIPRLGERTFRSDEARARDPRGSGLGLAITAEVCRRCGWALAFEPASPRGLRVTLRGPIA